MHVVPITTVNDDEPVGSCMDQGIDDTALMGDAGVDPPLQRGGSIGDADDVVVETVLELHGAALGGVGVEHRSRVDWLLVHEAMLRSLPAGLIRGPTTTVGWW